MVLLSFKEKEESSTANVLINFTLEEIEERSKIFKPASRPPNKYEAAINDACKDLCMKDGNLIMNRGSLLQKARHIVDKQGFAYRKGKSRSLELNPEPSRKRKYVTSEVKSKHVEDLQVNIASLEETIELLEKQKQVYIGQDKFLQAA